MELGSFSAVGEVGRPLGEERGISLAVGEERLRIELVRPDLARLSMSRAGRFDERPTFAASFVLPAPVEFDLRESRSAIGLETASLRLSISRPELHLVPREVTVDGADVTLDGASVVFENSGQPFELVATLGST